VSADTWSRRRAAAVEAAALAAIADPALAEPERRRAKLELAGAISEDRAAWDAALAGLTLAELETMRSILRRLVPRVGGAGIEAPFEGEAARREHVAEQAADQVRCGAGTGPGAAPEQAPSRPGPAPSAAATRPRARTGSRPS